MKKKIITVLSVLAIGFVSVSGNVSAASYSESTSEFGTFRASLTKSGSTVYGKTTTSKKSSQLYINVEIQDNATGNTIDYDENLVYNDRTCSTRVTSGKDYDLACFSCHEARGYSSVVKYFAEVF